MKACKIYSQILNFGQRVVNVGINVFQYFLAFMSFYLIGWMLRLYLEKQLQQKMQAKKACANVLKPR